MPPRTVARDVGVGVVRDVAPPKGVVAPPKGVVAPPVPRPVTATKVQPSELSIWTTWLG